ncbi:short chain dehydrogenase [Emydomyces testavorans]|uniref:Short chain dehydrogenase n=1 Tax=Emydomyces testavorans TaxID=2070801 RepID=A0AAF0IK94_9EURO|nr:short chain dehydrogenase [Emydomyces testavorans]
MKFASGRTIILTGASRGDNVVAIARSEEPLQRLKEQYGRQVEILNGDATDPEMADKAVKAALTAYGRIDGLIVNHGILGPVTKLVTSDMEAWRKAFDINFFSAVEFVKAALPHIRISRGNIIFTSSGAAISATIGWGFYGASKAAMNHLNMTLAKEEPEITCLAIRPGMVDTQMQEELRSQHVEVLGPKDSERFLTAHKEGKLLPPAKPGRVIAKLAVSAPRELSGKFLSWNSEELKDYQDE